MPQQITSLLFFLSIIWPKIRRGKKKKKTKKKEKDFLSNELEDLQKLILYT